MVFIGGGAILCCMAADTSVVEKQYISQKYSLRYCRSCCYFSCSCGGPSSRLPKGRFLSTMVQGLGASARCVSRHQPAEPASRTVCRQLKHDRNLRDWLRHSAV